MKAHKHLLASLIGASLLLTGVAMAQNQPMPSSTPQTISPDQNAGAMAPPASANGTDSTTLDNSKGQVTINSTMGPAPTTPPPPPFSTLSGGTHFITQAQAASYPPLANDFNYADSNRDGRISKAEYQRWVSHMN